jgi:hypothetical protein
VVQQNEDKNKYTQPCSHEGKPLAELKRKEKTQDEKSEYQRKQQGCKDASLERRERERGHLSIKALRLRDVP